MVRSIDAKMWGNDKLYLDLPGLCIKLSGLSKKQTGALRLALNGFVSPAENQLAGNDVICNVIRLGQPVDTPVKALSVDNQYAPLKLRKNKLGKFKVTGLDFKSTFDLNAPGCSSSLSVFKEEDIARAPVIDNYLRILSAHWVLRKNGVVLHSAGLVFDEKAYIFSGRSNAGKTTLTRKAYAKGARVLSDDINLVLPSKNNAAYNAYPVPFTGEFGRTLDHAGGKDSYPLAGVVLLEQSDCLKALPISPSAAVARLLTGCPFVNTDEHETEALFDSVTCLVSKVPVIRLLSRKDDDIDDIMNAVKQQFAALDGN